MVATTGVREASLTSLWGARGVGDLGWGGYCSAGTRPYAAAER
jgi:hypothetical protein